MTVLVRVSGSSALTNLGWLSQGTLYTRDETVSEVRRESIVALVKCLNVLDGLGTLYT